MVLESTVFLGPEGMVEFPATRTCGGDTSHTTDLKQKFKTRPEASISFNNLPLFCHQVSPPEALMPSKAHKMLGSKSLIPCSVEAFQSPSEMDTRCRVAYMVSEHSFF